MKKMWFLCYMQLMRKLLKTIKWNQVFPQLQKSKRRHWIQMIKFLLLKRMSLRKLVRTLALEDQFVPCRPHCLQLMTWVRTLWYWYQQPKLSTNGQKIEVYRRLPRTCLSWKRSVYSWIITGGPNALMFKEIQHGDQERKYTEKKDEWEWGKD